MNRKAWFGLALVLGMVGCGDITYESADLRGGGRNNPCATVRCAAGYHCEAHGRRAECVADEVADDAGVEEPTLSCASVLCIIGTVCEETPSGPRCGDPVQCFAAPCQVTSDVAACVDGQCVRTGTTF